MEKSVLDIIYASLDSFFESEKKIGIPAVSGTIWETQIGYTYNMTADGVKVISYTIPLPVC